MKVNKRRMSQIMRTIGGGTIGAERTRGGDG